MSSPVVIIGAGPAGLTAAYELSKHNTPSVVLEKSGVVGGIAQTVNYKGYLFDIGGHRFFTKVSLIEQIWRDVLKEDLLVRQRLSRIYYNSRFFQYPLEPWNALEGLGLLESLRCGLSYLRSALAPRRPEDHFEAWVSNRFGSRLYNIFFKTYTEKVWGMPCNEIDAEWAAQRIRGLSLRSAVWEALRGKNGNSDRASTIKTLIHQFEYPRRGPGMMWERFHETIEKQGSSVVFHAPVERIRWSPGRIESVEAGGVEYRGEHFISSMPIRELLGCLDPAPDPSLREAAGKFNYRDFLTVALVVRGGDLFPDNWIYVHEPTVRVGRIQNFKNWSPEMVPNPDTTCLGLEYFCFEGDELWTMSDDDLVALGRKEMARLGLVGEDQFLDGTVVRMPKAYPVYDRHYRDGLAAVRRFLEQVPNLQLVGRNGMHHYNNQDHSMLTAIYAARNVLGGNYDLWSVNVEEDYHEEGERMKVPELDTIASSQPHVPTRKLRPSA